MLGHEYPDVVALQAAQGSATKSADALINLVVPFPPMLMAGWRAVIAADTLQSTVVPADSISERAAATLFASGPWVTWKVPHEVERREIRETVIGSFPPDLVFDSDVIADFSQLEL